MRRQVGAQQFWQVYGIVGELVAEYEWNNTTQVATLQKEYGYRGGEMLIVAEGATVRWLVTDHLGTPRMIADQTGSLAGMRRHDYFPFGEDNLARPTIRTAGNGYQAEGVRQKHTGYERDAETNLDYAQARYFANLQGRFTSPDGSFAGQDEYDPQTWNLYAYTSNNPLIRVDPDGHRWFYKQNPNGSYSIQWVNPNDDGTYTSPGVGWIELAPDKELVIHIKNGRQGFVIAENSDGSPYISETLSTGKVERNLATLAADIAFTVAVQGVIGRAVGAWNAYKIYKARKNLRVWEMSLKDRGLAIEKELGGNLPQGFQTIDKFENGVATSIKSIDLRASTYQNAKALGSRLNGYIDDLAGFQGASRADVTIRSADIVTRELQVAVPSGAMNAAQQAAFNAASQYAQSLGVRLSVIPFP